MYEGASLNLKPRCPFLNSDGIVPAASELRQTGQDRCVHRQTNRHPKRKLVLKKRRQVELPVRETVKGPLDMLYLHYKTRAHDPNSNSAAAPCSMQSLPLLFLFDSCHVIGVVYEGRKGEACEKVR